MNAYAWKTCVALGARVTEIKSHLKAQAGFDMSLMDLGIKQGLNPNDNWNILCCFKEEYQFYQSVYP